MKKLIILAVVLKVFWGPLPENKGVYLGRKKMIAGGWKEINYYVVRLKDGSISFIEPDIIEKVKGEEE